MKKIIFLFLLTPIIALAGHDQGGGGDATEIEFANIGRSLVKVLKSERATLGYNFVEFETAVNNVSVEMVRHELSKNGNERDGRNFPSKRRIVVNRNEWIQLKATQKVPFVYHEYLAVAGIEHDTPIFSRDLMSLIGAQKMIRIASDALPPLQPSTCDQIAIEAVKWSVRQSSDPLVEIVMAGSGRRGVLGMDGSYIDIYAHLKSGKTDRYLFRIDLLESEVGELSSCMIYPCAASKKYQNKAIGISDLICNGLD